MDSMKVLSFFSGAMGMDLGLEAAGLDIVLSHDFDKFCIQTMMDNDRPCMGYQQ